MRYIKYFEKFKSMYSMGFPNDCNYICDTIDGVEEWFRENL